MTTFRIERPRKGFTLVELLVVIVIIGILAAILVPVANRVFTRSKETKVLFQIKQMSMAAEQYKNELGAYPLDMSDPRLLPAHVQVVSRNNLYDPTGDGSVLGWYQATLRNPHFGEVRGSPEFRSPQTMNQAEALVFFLSEMCQNADYPLGYRWDGNTWQLLLDDRHKFYDFQDTQLRDLDGDGWLEYVQPAGPEIPMIYFDSKTYFQTNQDFLPVGVAAFDASIYLDARGFAQPYYKRFFPDREPYYDFIEPDKFQIIAAGIDGDFGQPPYLYSSDGGGFAKLYNVPNDEFGLREGEEDNLTSFVEGRLDSEIE